MTRIVTAALVLLPVCLLAGAGHGQYPPAVVIPGNGAGYSADSKTFAAILDELKGIREELKALRAGAPAKPGADRRAAQQQVLLRACAGCHTPAKVEAGKDGGFILFADDESRALKPLTEREWKAVRDEIDAKTMPKQPKPPLTAAERQLFP